MGATWTGEVSKSRLVLFGSRIKIKFPSTPPTVRDNSGSWEIPEKKKKKPEETIEVQENGAGGANQKILNHHLKHSQAAAERGVAPRANQALVFG